ncbi:MAG TPA: hypothetical protein VFW71_12175 [Actinomycetota bacterium]|nr:hypothetical protein [Actinomycetota bacterium]
MKRILAAFSVGLAVGLGSTAVRVVLRARKGLPTAGPGGGLDVSGANNAIDEFGNRIKSALEQGTKAMKDAEAELRAKVLHDGPH